MKRFFFILFIFLIWYMAAMYRIPSLMALSVAQLFLLLLLFLMTRYFRNNFQAGFCRKKETVRKKDRISVQIWTENRSILPLGRYRLQFYSSYEKSRKGKSFPYDGSIDSKKREEEELQLEAKWCGKLYISLEQKQVYDYLSLFHSRVKENQEAEIAVLPSSQPLTVIFSEADTWENQGQGEGALRLERSSGGEIRQLREYAPGDLVRGIHWKQSARTDKLLVKEFQKEEEEGVSLYLDFSGEKEPGPEEMSAFYQILSAFLLGVLKEKAAVRVKWTDAQKRSLYRRVTTEEACMDLLLLLYDREEILFIKRPSGKNFMEDFTLNLNREIYYKEQCIHRFSLENCERELKETKIILS